MAPPQLPEGERRDTVTISKKLYDSVVWAASLLVLGISGVFWHIHLNDVHQDGVLKGLEKDIKALERGIATRDCCTGEACQNLRESIQRLQKELERLRGEHRSHITEAEVWKQRIVKCEIQVSDCVSCRLQFGIRKNGEQ